MSRQEINCPHCDGLINLKEAKPKKPVRRHIALGALTGLLIGAIFDYFYFYIGVITDYFSFMPIVHLVAGVLLGALIGWINGQRKYLGL